MTEFTLRALLIGPNIGHLATLLKDGAPLPFREFATGLLATRGIVPQAGSVAVASAT